MTDKQAEQFRNAHRAVDAPEIQPSEEEARNGWDAESLTAYLHDQAAAQALRADPHSLQRRVRPIRQNNSYSPLRWRR